LSQQDNVQEDSGKIYIIDDRIESYSGFLESGFVRIAIEASDNSRQISILVNHLMADWRSISYAVAFPSLSSRSVESFHLGMTSVGPVDYSLTGLMEALLVRLQDRLPALRCDKELQQDLRAELNNLIAQIGGLKDKSDRLVSAHAVWSEIIKQHPMHMGIHEIMRLSYIGIFACYEEFLVRSVRLLSSRNDLQSTSKKFRQILNETLGKDKTDICWSSREISNIRKIRNALTHAGGRLKDNDSVIPGTIYLDRDCMHVFPEHITCMYLSLKPAILTLITHPGFA
jgi:hypothetical protein